MSAQDLYMVYKIIGAMLWIPIIIVLVAVFYHLWNDIND
jgi:hypothetical protein